MRTIGKIFSITAFILLLSQQAIAQKKQAEATGVFSKSPQVSKDKAKIQTTLQHMGYYSGQIDANLKTFASCKAIKLMHEALDNGQSPYLKEEEAILLTKLAPLYRVDQHLAATNQSTKERNKQIQTSLRILGFSTTISDGIMGPRSWARVAKYKKANGLDDKLKLTTKERKELIAKARVKNAQAIEKLKEQLRKK